MKKISVLAALLLIISLAFTGCISSKSTAPQQQAQNQSGEKTQLQKDAKVVKIGSTVTDTHPITQGEYYFEKIFEERTNGAYDVQVYPNMQLGSPREMFEALQLGNLEMTDSGSMAISAFTKKFAFLSLPNLFPNREVAFKFADSEIAKQLYKEIAAECGILPAGPVENGYLTVGNNVRAIHTPDDMKGLKLRVQESDIYIKVYQLLGANPMPMAFNEVFTALQQKTIDGLNTTDIIFDTGKFYEVTKHFSDLNPFYDVGFIFASDKWVKSLPEDVKKIYFECMAEACKYQRDLSAKLTAESLANLEKTMTVTKLTDAERAVFQKRLEPIYPWFKEKYNDPNLDKYMAEIDRLAK